MALVQPAGYSRLREELEYYRKRCSELESLVESLQDENKQLKEQLRSVKETVSAMVARSVGAKPATKNHHKKPGRKKGHPGMSRKRPEHVDARVTIDQETCSICGKSTLSERPSSYTRVVTDIVPAKPVVTEYTVNRRYCSTCKKLVSPPPVPGVLPKEVFGLRLMLLIVSLKLLGMPYEKISDHLQLLFNLRISDAAIKHAVAKVAQAFGPRYNQLIDDLQKEKNIRGDETSWPVNGRNHWLWAFVGRWTVVYEVDQSREKDVPAMILSGYAGTVTSDSWPAWNHVGGSHQKCLVHYLREIEDTIQYKNPGKEFYAFGKRLRRILKDAIRSDEKYRKVKDRLKAKARLEQRVQILIAAGYRERNCLRLVKRLKREKGMLFTFLEKEYDWNNNAAERAIRPSIVVRKVTYGNKSLDVAKTHAVLMTVRETCRLRGQNFYDYALKYLGDSASKR